MKIAVLAVATNIHTIRWANALAERGVDVLLITQQPPRSSDYHPAVVFRILPFRGALAYALNAPILRYAFDRSGADLLHVHYAGGYGAMAWLSGIRRRLVSVWGGDVYDVPHRSFLHRRLVLGALRGALRISSTSHVMADEVRRLGITEQIDVIPFGVDTSAFRTRPEAQGDDPFVIGTVKSLQRKYGIDTLIRGFTAALADPAFAALNPILRIAGEGEARAEYESLARALGQNRVRFEGHIDHGNVPDMLRQFHIYVAVSRDDSESFGVAIIEASACGLPVIVSDAGGLPEVVDHESTGLVIPRDSPSDLARAIVRLALDAPLRQRMGEAGRQRVQRQYEWSACVERMIQLYRELCVPPLGLPTRLQAAPTERTDGFHRNSACKLAPAE
jgi:glycosyltransferase involved in cell wall biosynthesis